MSTIIAALSAALLRGHKLEGEDHLMRLLGRARLTPGNRAHGFAELVGLIQGLLIQAGIRARQQLGFPK
jgi:hypothetical protein